VETLSGVTPLFVFLLKENEWKSLPMIPGFFRG